MWATTSCPSGRSIAHPESEKSPAPAGHAAVPLCNSSDEWSSIRGRSLRVSAAPTVAPDTEKKRWSRPVRQWCVVGRGFTFELLLGPALGIAARRKNLLERRFHEDQE
jgi:hypothetical protein